MAKKRKAGKSADIGSRPRKSSRLESEDHFNDSEDEFYAGRDKILLDEEPAAKRRRKLQEQEEDLQPSDDEVYEDAQEDDFDDDLDQAPEDDSVDLDRQLVNGEDEDAEDDERLWGTSKADYYNADTIETEADALEEEAEAKRLQQKQLKRMTDADFGFDETTWADESKTSQAQQRRHAIEKLPEVKIPDGASPDEKLQILRARYPEFEPLTADFRELQEVHSRLKKEKEAISVVKSPQSLDSTPVVITKFRALSAYLAVLAMYLAILTSSKSGIALPPAELRDHPVMKHLLRCRQLWQDAEKLKDVEQTTETEVAVAPIQDSIPHAAPTVTKEPRTKKDKKDKKEKKKTKSKQPLPSPSPTPSLESLPPIDFKPKKPRRPKRNDLQELLNSTLHNVSAEQDSDFGDENPLTREEVEEKAKRKKSLRFYTSQIAQKANKRGAASRQAGGDDDVPHKERIRDRQDRLMREATDRGRANPEGDEALDFEAEDDDDAAVQGRDRNDDDDEYYNTLVLKSKQKKQDKAARAAAYAQAAKEGAQVYEEEQIGDDGKRRITYAIEKNKGLAPKRSKDVRNPRVKKRKKYDEKMKKLGSMRQLYKGGEGRGGYGGELTGIKTNLVKSVKL